MLYIYTFLLSSIPLYSYHKLFIHLPVNGHLGYFQLWVIMIKLLGIFRCLYVDICFHFSWVSIYE